MLSVYTIKSAADAMDYYKPQNYYAQNMQGRSEWFGRGAALLGLEGRVDAKIFEALLYGRLPNGVLMRQTQYGLHHRPGYDLTFSAPKSVSILALVLCNKAILNAHTEAVKETLVIMEAKYAASRKKTGDPYLERTGNFLFGLFTEIDSRSGNPHLHTHSVLMNMTQMLDTAWHTIFGDFLYDEKMLCGLIYRSQLASKLMHLGHVLRFEANGLFEIAAVPVTLIDFFSTRGAQITAWMEEHGLTGGKAAQIANFLTRSYKQSVSPEQRSLQWTEELQQANSSLEALERIVQEATEKGPVQAADPYVIAQGSVAMAIAHLSERQGTFSIQKLIEASKLMSVLPASEGDFLRAIEAQLENKTLIYLEDKRLSLPEILAFEKENGDRMQAGKGAVRPILPGWIASLVISAQARSRFEGDILKQLLKNTDQQIMVRASCSTLLESALKSFVKLAENYRYYPRFVVQNTLRAERLQKILGSEKIGTLEGFLSACAHRGASQKEPLLKLPAWLTAWDKRLKAHESREIWLVEGPLTFKAVSELQHYATQFGARLVFIQAGRGLSPALRALESQSLRSLRIQTPAHYKEDLAQSKSLVKGLGALEATQSLHVASTYEARIERALSLYQGFHPERSRFVCSHEALRQRLNERARLSLQTEGFLRAQRHQVPSLQRIPLSHTQKTQAYFYQLGDVLRFGRPEVGSGIAKDSYWTITEIDLKTGLLSLKNNDQVTLQWAPAHAPVSANGVRSVEVFRPLLREVQVGESLVWTRSLRAEMNHEADRLKNQSAQVIGVQGTCLEVMLDNGTRVFHDTLKPEGQHWDYGYACLAKQLSLNKIDTFIVLQGHAIEASAIEVFAVLLQGAAQDKKTIHWVTDDVAKLQETVEKGGLAALSESSLEQPYARHEALAEDQRTVTQCAFHGLQGAYLEGRELNPEFFPHNLEKPSLEPEYSPAVRAACDSLEQVCLYQAERQAVLSVRDLQEQALLLGGAGLSYTHLQAAFEIAFEKGWLVKLPDYAQHERVVCRHSLFLEKFCIQKMQEGKNQLSPLMSSDATALQALQENSRFTQGQKEAIALVMTTPDRMVVVQGIAGAGKTTMLKEVHGLCQSVGTSALIIANTGSAKNQAKQQYAGIQAMTTAQFLTRMEGALSRDREQAKKDLSLGLIIVDESSMMSSQQLLRFEKIVGVLEAHSVLLGDFKQIGSIGAGTSLYDALAYGANKALMNENVRLKTPLAFQAMKQTYQGDIRGALRTLHNSIEEIPNKDEALEKMMKLYSALEPSEHPDYVLITPLNKDRDTVNEGVRELLKERGFLEGNPLAMRVLLPVDQREASKRSVQGYSINQVLRFNTDHPRMAIKAGTYATIKKVDTTYHRLNLKLENNQDYDWSPKNMKQTSEVEVYEQSTRQLLKGDYILFKRNDEALGIFNGDKATVTKVEGHQFEVVLFNGQSVRLDAHKSMHQHLDYGYAITPNTVQSRNVPFVIAYGVGFKPRMELLNDLVVGDRIALDREEQGHPDLDLVDSKLVSITKLEPALMEVQDAEGKRYVITKDLGREWKHYPAAEDRKPREFPLAMSQQQLLVILSRGDGFCVFVPSIDDFRTILERNEKHQSSALSHFDPEHKARDAAVKNLLATIRGKAEPQAESQAPRLAVAGPSPLRGNPKTFARIDVDALNARLEGDLLGYATQLLGRPKKLTTTDARWEGTLSLRLKGDKAGVWSRWSTGDKGYGLVSLYTMVHDVPWKEALKAWAEICGIVPQRHSERASIPKLSPASQSPARSEQVMKQEKIQWAQTVYQSGIPIPGTLAERYLREHRHITGTLPEDFRYSPGLKHLDTKQLTPALMAPLRDKDHRITGMVRIFLNKDGSKLDAPYLDQQGQWQQATAKANLGVAEHSGVLVQQGLGTLWVAEGIETALSIAQAMPHQKIMASTSVDRLRTIPVGSDIHTVVLCADKDEAGSQTFKALLKAVEHHLSEGKKVFLAMPGGTEKCDFNDLMQKDGVVAVREALDRRVEITDPKALQGGIEALFEKKQGVIASTLRSSESIETKLETEKSIGTETKVITKDLDQGRER